MELWRVEVRTDEEAAPIHAFVQSQHVCLWCSVPRY